jgi:hypothetical protein
MREGNQMHLPGERTGVSANEVRLPEIQFKLFAFF